MKSRKCRLCGGELFTKPLLILKGMPKAAQFFPEKNEFSSDKPVTLDIYSCSACGLTQLASEPVDYFREVITAATLSGKSRASRLAQMREFSEKFGLKGAKVVEIGSGKGEMLDVIAEAGMKAFGLEFSPASVSAARTAGRELIQGYIGEMKEIKGAPFDAFICLNYLEHLPEPGAAIRAIADNLSGPATGFVTVPNLGYLLKTRSFYEFVADHLSYFTEKTLSHAFEANGFEVLDCRLINEENDVAVTVRKRPETDISAQFGEVEALMEDFRRLVSEYSSRGKKVAVWGAGHRTLALMALSGVKDVAYVIDSARFKQGRFTPVLHLPISAPERLESEPPALVIVMVPGLYPGEVLKILEKDYPGIDVAILKDNKIEIARRI
ncbi:MAG: methyltransferase [Elusimicrobia bacterium CG08_land_8_20_14_0_20_51_18]|nr:MAG: methyltransferase [Elusimicrobia bacterium CG08_land_8_20_14_0_20_51_18]